MAKRFHSSFKLDPAKIAETLDVGTLLERNSFDQSEIHSANSEIEGSSCFLCLQQITTRFIKLNTGDHLCDRCLHELSLIKFPEKYDFQWRKFLSLSHAHELACEALEAHWSKKVGWTLTAAGAALSPFLIPVGTPVAIAGLISILSHRGLLKRWRAKNPVPHPPAVRSFTDENAELTEKDLRIFRVFEHWPGYPPFWDDLKKTVRERDRHRCQATGCPCPKDLKLHVHHRKRISQGGAHREDNLVTLCEFHHATEPDDDHFQLLEKTETARFLVVHSHYRRNRREPGSHRVRAHLRRKQLATAEDIQRILDLYDLSCPRCQCRSFRIEILEVPDRVRLQCRQCGDNYSGENQLPEEVGPRLAKRLTVGRNKGRWS